MPYFVKMVTKKSAHINKLTYPSQILQTLEGLRVSFPLGVLGCILVYPKVEAQKHEHKHTDGRLLKLSYVSPRHNVQTFWFNSF